MSELTSYNNTAPNGLIEACLSAGVHNKGEDETSSKVLASGLIQLRALLSKKFSISGLVANFSQALQLKAHGCIRQTNKALGDRLGLPLRNVRGYNVLDTNKKPTELVSYADGARNQLLVDIEFSVGKQRMKYQTTIRQLSHENVVMAAGRVVAVTLLEALGPAECRRLLKRVQSEPALAIPEACRLLTAAQV